MKQFFLIVAIILQTSAALLAQDAIYTANGNRLDGARLIGISETSASFVVGNSDRADTLVLLRENLLIAFNKIGNYLVISELEDDLSLAQFRLDTFLTAPPRSPASDYLITAVPLTVVPAIISYESAALVNYRTQSGESASISKEELIGILYRDGRHALLKDPVTVAPLLIDVRAMLAPAVTPPVPYIPKPVVPGPDTIATPSEEKSTSGLDEAEYQSYRNKALQQVSQFVSYLNIITDKRLSTTVKDKAIAQAVKLFMPAATIEVTSGKPGSRRYPIQDYLTRLKFLPYTSTRITWSQVQYVRELTKALDGNYYGLITGEQTFIGYGTSRKPMYSDVVRKNVRVKMRPIDIVNNGKRDQQWEVLLGSIGVVAN
jgi:hypothetical protein